MCWELSTWQGKYSKKCWKNILKIIESNLFKVIEFGLSMVAKVTHFPTPSVEWKKLSNYQLFKESFSQDFIILRKKNWHLDLFQQPLWGKFCAFNFYHFFPQIVLIVNNNGTVPLGYYLGDKNTKYRNDWLIEVYHFGKYLCRRQILISRPYFKKSSNIM